MATQRTKFSKRQREQNLKDKARAKQQRLAARRFEAAQRTEKGPPIANPVQPEPYLLPDASTESPDDIDPTREETFPDSPSPPGDPE